MARLGYVGLGVMGGRMAKRLLDAGHTVTGYNRTKSKADWLLEAGIQWADSPRAVAEAADVTFSMVTNTKALRAVTGGPDGILAGLGAGKIYVDMSTVSPAFSQELAAQVAEIGAQMVDAPVSGSVETLEKGKLSIMVGGDPDVFASLVGLEVDGRDHECHAAAVRRWPRIGHPLHGDQIVDVEGMLLGAGDDGDHQQGEHECAATDHDASRLGTPSGLIVLHLGRLYGRTALRLYGGTLDLGVGIAQIAGHESTEGRVVGPAQSWMGSREILAQAEACAYRRTYGSTLVGGGFSPAGGWAAPYGRGRVGGGTRMAV